MAHLNSAAPDQTAPKGDLISTYTFYLSTKYFVEQMHKKNKAK